MNAVVKERQEPLPQLRPAAPAPAPAAAPQLESLKGTALALGTIALSLATFMNVLDTSIANVAIPVYRG